MKTQIIILESHDDLISVRDRLSWAKTPRILLVWPKYEKVTLRQVDLKVLQRHASSLGAQLGLVTRTRRVRADAEALGLPVFESTGQAQRVAWPALKRTTLSPHVPDKSLREKREQVAAKEEAWRIHPVTRVAAFAIGVLSVLAIVALFIPRAQVTLKPVVKTQNVTISVSANPSVQSVVITGSIPAHEKRIVVDGVQSITVTGTGVVPQSKSKGVVEFRNLTQQSVVIPAGTVVSANDARFVTTEDRVLDAGVGKKIEAPIEAAVGGTAGNVDAGAIKAIEGRLSLSLSVTNAEPTTGGHELASLQASDNDRTRVKAALMKSLEIAAREKISNELAPGDILFENTLKDSQILLEDYEPPAGAAGTKLTLNMQVEYSAEYASASDLTELATLAMNASLPTSFSPSSSIVTVKSSSTPTLADDGSIHWTMNAERTIHQAFDSEYVTQLVQGVAVRKAQTNLNKNLPAASSPKLQMSPVWWPWVSFLPFRIDVVTR